MHLVFDNVSKGENKPTGADGVICGGMMHGAGWGIRLNRAWGVPPGDMSPCQSGVMPPQSKGGLRGWGGRDSCAGEVQGAKITGETTESVLDGDTCKTA